MLYRMRRTQVASWARMALRTSPGTRHVKCGASVIGSPPPPFADAALPRWLSREKGVASHRGVHVFHRPDSTHNPLLLADWHSPMLLGPPWLGSSFKGWMHLPLVMEWYSLSQHCP
eukprot:scaffold11495_cov132-Isochrysis_galbana.AAC.6